jgi:hypothetical protein
MEQDFRIDRLTDSILNRISGDSFQTEVARLRESDLKTVTNKAGWKFNWKAEWANEVKEVYKLTIVQNPDIIQGLLSITNEQDHIYIHLLESAPFNLGRDKLYEGVPGNLVAFACKVSFQMGMEGYVAFVSKTSLIKHYEKTLGAIHFKHQRMIIATSAARALTRKYFKT